MDRQATFKTERGKRYLAALCHHFGRKLETGHDAKFGWINFPFGRCELRATSDLLTVQICSETKSDLDRLAQVVSSHFERFAFRENPQLEWRPTLDAQLPA